jgi:integrase
MGTAGNAAHRAPKNKGRIVGQKAPSKLKHIRALRVRLQMEGRLRELALFNLGIDSRLRGCDLVALRVRDMCHGDRVATRAIVIQHKTQRPVQFEITQAPRDALQAWIKQAALKPEYFLFPSRLHDSPHLGTRHAHMRRRTAAHRRSARRRRIRERQPHGAAQRRAGEPVRRVRRFAAHAPPRRGTQRLDDRPWRQAGPPSLGISGCRRNCAAITRGLP